MEDPLVVILREVRNLSFLFFAYGIIWLLLFLYLWSISRRERDLRREVEELKKLNEPESIGDEED
jgi:CcmD family protein